MSCPLRRGKNCRTNTDHHMHQGPHPTARYSGHMCPSALLPTPVPRSPTEQRWQWHWVGAGRWWEGCPQVNPGSSPAHASISKHKFNNTIIKIQDGSDKTLKVQTGSSWWDTPSMAPSLSSPWRGAPSAEPLSGCCATRQALRAL